MEVKYLPGVGPKRAELLKKELEVSTVGELLRIFPFRYIDRSSFVRIADARPDMAYVQIRATVMRIDVHDSKRMSAWVADGSGENSYRSLYCLSKKAPSSFALAIAVSLA